jgi:Uma2 family endonuclease
MSRYRYEFRQYLAYERDAAMKHEFVDGEIIGIPGVSPRHSARAVNLMAAIERGSRSDCHCFASDLRVRVLATGRVAYPKTSMVCGPIECDPADPYRETVTNPVLLVEILSAETEDVLRGDKRHDYQLIPTLQEYVLVSQDQPRIEIYRRQSAGNWEYIDVREGSVKLATGPSLDLADLYDDLPE